MWPLLVETGRALWELPPGPHECARSKCSRHCLITPKALGEIVRATSSWSQALVPGEAEEAKQTRVPPCTGSDPGKSRGLPEPQCLPSKNGMNPPAP